MHAPIFVFIIVFSEYTIFCPWVKLICILPPVGEQKATNEAMCFKELIKLVIFCKQIQERPALDFINLYVAFNNPYLQRRKNSGVTNEDGW